MEDLIQWIEANSLFTVIGAITLIQIIPLKIDPWTWIANKIKRFLISDLEKDVQQLKDDIVDMQQELINDHVSNTRWQILYFANSSRQGINHTKEEWIHCLEEIDWYEEYCEKNKVHNNVILECSNYIKTTYLSMLENNKFLGEI